MNKILIWAPDYNIYMPFDMHAHGRCHCIPQYYIQFNLVAYGIFFGCAKEHTVNFSQCFSIIANRKDNDSSSVSSSSSCLGLYYNVSFLRIWSNMKISDSLAIFQSFCLCFKSRHIVAFQPKQNMLQHNTQFLFLFPFCTTLVSYLQDLNKYSSYNHKPDLQFSISSIVIASQSK